MGRPGIDVSAMREPFRAYLAQNGTTPTALARELKLDPSTLCRFANRDKRTFDRAIAERVAIAIGFPLRRLRGLEPDVRTVGIARPPGDQRVPPQQLSLPMGRGPHDALFVISYAREDAADFAQLVAAQLRLAGLSPWLDVDSIETGSRWPTSVRDAIASCAALVLVVSAGIARSWNVARETAFAESARIPIVPVILHPGVAVPGDLGVCQGLSFGDPQNRPWDRLVKTLEGHAGK